MTQDAPDTLREALRVAEFFVDTDGCNSLRYRKPTDAELAALASPEPPLDVDRLLAACRTVGGVDPENPDGWDDFASEVAAEYARLSRRWVDSEYTVRR